METNLENITKPRYWAELPLEIGGKALECFARDMNCLLNRIGSTATQPGLQMASITYLEARQEPEDIVA